MATQAIHTTVLSSSHPNIIKRISASGVTISAILFMVGMLVFMSTFAIADHTSALSVGLGVLGIAFMAWGGMHFFAKNKEEVYTPTGSVVDKQSFYFNLRHLDELKRFVQTGDLNCVSEIEAQQGGNIRMDLLGTRDQQFIALQLLQFIPYMYSPITSVFYFTGDEAATISAFIDRKKK